MARSKPNIKEKILDCAVTLLRDGGGKKLAQPQVAKAAGVPQGHLTYYFPRKSDLLAAVAQRCLSMTEQERAGFYANGGVSKEQEEAVSEEMEVVNSYLRDMGWNRMVLGLIMEADEDEQVRDHVHEYFRQNSRRMAQHLGLPADDPLVEFFHCAYLGIGVRYFAHQGSSPAKVEELTSLVPTLLKLVIEKKRSSPAD